MKGPLGATPPFVMCVGSAALDLVLEVDSLPDEDGRVAASSGFLAGGGPAATAAVALSRLGSSVVFAGRVGDDPAGTLIRDGLAAEGVDVSLLAVAAGSSPLSSAIVRSSSGSRTLVASPGSASPVEVTPEVVAAANAATWIHADHAGFRVARELRARGVDTLLSVDGGNPIDDLDLSTTDLYAPAAGELRRWTGAASIEAGLAAAVDAGATITVATDGAAGVTAHGRIHPDAPNVSRAVRAARAARGDRASTTWTIHQDAFPIAAGTGSTLGAGDVFHGALLASIVAGRSLRAALAFASAAAALSCAGVDGRSGIPTRVEVERLVASGGRSVAAVKTA